MGVVAAVDIDGAYGLPPSTTAEAYTHYYYFTSDHWSRGEKEM